MRMPVAQAVKKACILFGRFLSLAKGKPKNTVKPAKAPRATISAVDMLPSLVHLHLTFSGLVCILSLKERQEQCPFTTRLRVLKLDQASGYLDGLSTGEFGAFIVIDNLTFGQFLVPLLIRFHNAPVIRGQLLISLIKDGDRAPDDPPHDSFDTELTIDVKQRTTLGEAHQIFMEGGVRLNVALEVHKAIAGDQGQRRLHALAEL